MAWVRRADGASAVNYVLLCALLCGVAVLTLSLVEGTLGDNENGLGAYFLCHLSHLGGAEVCGGAANRGGDDLFNVGPDGLGLESPDRAVLDPDTEWQAYEHAFRLHALATGVDVPNDPTQLSALVEAFRDSGDVTMYPLRADPPKRTDQKCRELVSRGVLACARLGSVLFPERGGIQNAVVEGPVEGGVVLVAATDPLGTTPEGGDGFGNKADNDNKEGSPRRSGPQRRMGPRRRVSRRTLVGSALAWALSWVGDEAADAVINDLDWIEPSEVDLQLDEENGLAAWWEGPGWFRLQTRDDGVERRERELVFEEFVPGEGSYFVARRDDGLALGWKRKALEEKYWTVNLEALPEALAERILNRPGTPGLPDELNTGLPPLPAGKEYVQFGNWFYVLDRQAGTLRPAWFAGSSGTTIDPDAIQMSATEGGPEGNGGGGRARDEEDDDAESAVGSTPAAALLSDATRVYPRRVSGPPVDIRLYASPAAARGSAAATKLLIEYLTAEDEALAAVVKGEVLDEGHNDQMPFAMTRTPGRARTADQLEGHAASRFAEERKSLERDLKEVLYALWSGEASHGQSVTRDYDGIRYTFRVQQDGLVRVEYSVRVGDRTERYRVHLSVELDNYSLVDVDRAGNPTGVGHIFRVERIEELTGARQQALEEPVSDVIPMGDRSVSYDRNGFAYRVFTGRDAAKKAAALKELHQYLHDLADEELAKLGIDAGTGYKNVLHEYESGDTDRELRIDTGPPRQRVVTLSEHMAEHAESLAGDVNSEHRRTVAAILGADDDGLFTFRGRRFRLVWPDSAVRVYEHGAWGLIPHPFLVGPEVPIDPVNAGLAGAELEGRQATQRQPTLALGGREYQIYDDGTVVHRFRTIEEARISAKVHRNLAKLKDSKVPRVRRRGRELHSTFPVDTVARTDLSEEAARRARREYAEWFIQTALASGFDINGAKVVNGRIVQLNHDWWLARYSPEGELVSVPLPVFVNPRPRWISEAFEFPNDPTTRVVLHRDGRVDIRSETGTRLMHRDPRVISAHRTVMEVLSEHDLVPSPQEREDEVGPISLWLPRPDVGSDEVLLTHAERLERGVDMRLFERKVRRLDGELIDLMKKAGFQEVPGHPGTFNIPVTRTGLMQQIFSYAGLDGTLVRLGLWDESVVPVQVRIDRGAVLTAAGETGTDIRSIPITSRISRGAREEDVGELHPDLEVKVDAIVSTSVLPYQRGVYVYDPWRREEGGERKSVHELFPHDRRPPELIRLSNRRVVAVRLEEPAYAFFRGEATAVPGTDLRRAATVAYGRDFAGLFSDSFRAVEYPGEERRALRVDAHGGYEIVHLPERITRFLPPEGRDIQLETAEGAGVYSLNKSQWQELAEDFFLLTEGEHPELPGRVFELKGRGIAVGSGNGGDVTTVLAADRARGQEIPGRGTRITEMIATDKHPPAVSVFSRNIRDYADEIEHPARLIFRETDITAGIDGPIYFGVSNPPAQPARITDQYTGARRIRDASSAEASGGRTVAMRATNEAGPDGGQVVRGYIEQMHALQQGVPGAWNLFATFRRIPDVERRLNETYGRGNWKLIRRRWTLPTVMETMKEFFEQGRDLREGQPSYTFANGVWYTEWLVYVAWIPEEGAESVPPQ